ncbi:MAG: Uma2 family endonuclease [Oscillospiraceae bacterium]|nr:Uma2 family endonuclease [Oscillospiraceae bacterium]
MQPDIFVVCDTDKLTENSCDGAPDFIAEILSPSTGRKDRLLKMNLYLEAGVREYWIISPEYSIVETYVLQDGHYIAAGNYTTGDHALISIFPGFSIDLSTLFPPEEEEAEAT